MPIRLQLPARRGRWRTLLFAFVWIVLLASAPAVWAQSMSYYLASPTATEYVFDTPVPADFADMFTATGVRYSAFQAFPTLTHPLIDGKPRLVVANEIAWDGDKIDQGMLAFRHQGRVEGGWWFNMDASNPQWPALAARIKAQATISGNWRYASLQVLATTDANSPPARMPIPATVQARRQMVELGKQTRAGIFYPSVQVPAQLDAFRAQMLAYGNAGRKDPDFRKNAGAKTATNLAGDTVTTLGGTEKVFKQNRTPPWFSDSVLNDKLNLAAQFQAEYIASIKRMGHDGPTSFTDPRTGKRGNLHDLGLRADFFEIPRNVVEAAGGGSAGDSPHNWMASDTHFRPWFSVDGVYPELGYGAALASDGTWYFVAVATRHADGVVPGNADGASAGNGFSAPAPESAPAPAVAPDVLISLQSGNFPDRYIRHRDLKGFLDPVASDLDRKDSTFRRVAGLADGAQVSLEAANHPGYFLVTEGEAVVLRNRPANDAAFDRNATFIPLPGLADASKLSLESWARRGSYLRHTGFVLYVHPTHDSELFRADATFRQVAPNCSGAGCAP